MGVNRNVLRLFVLSVITMIMFVLFVQNSSFKEEYVKYGSKGTQLITGHEVIRYITGKNVSVNTPESNLRKYSIHSPSDKVNLNQTNKRAVLRQLQNNHDSHSNSDPLPNFLKLQDDIAVSSNLDASKSRRRHEDDLISGLIPTHFYYLWCGKRWFEFKHYLSVISVIKALDPHKVYFFFEHTPSVDRFYYHQWIDNLKHDHPFFIYKRMPKYLSKFCTVDPDAKLDIIMKLLDTEGGIYISENTWMLDLKPSFLKNDFAYALEPASTDGFVMLRGGMLKNNTLQMLLKDNRYAKLTCATVNAVYNNSSDGPCLTVKGGRFNRFKPMDIWDLKDPFGRLARKIYYGTEKILAPEPSFETLVPNIGHMVWIGGGKMDFLFYLSALSVLHVVNVDTLYIHGDREPKGEYWAKLKGHKRIQFVTRMPTYDIYQGSIPKKWHRALMSDIIRVDLMIKYGGIYTDTDAIWVKPLTREDRGYDAVASYDWVDWTYPFPDTVNFGLSYGKKNAPFWRVFRETMRVLHNEVHGFTGVMEPYKLLERYPHLLRIDRRLQVICYHSKCHPLWVPGYHDIKKNHVTMNSIKNWREDVYAFHWTHPNPKEYKNMSTLMNSNSMFAEIGKHVLRKSGII